MDGSRVTCGKTGHSAADCWSTKKSDFCGKTGHHKDVCFNNPQSPSYRSTVGSAASGIAGSPPALNADSLAMLQSLTHLMQSSAPSVASMPSSAGALARAAPTGQPPGLASAATYGGHPMDPQHAAYERANALLKQQFGLEACAAQPDDGDLLLDTGATFHFSGQEVDLRPLDEPIDILDSDRASEVHGMHDTC